MRFPHKPIGRVSVIAVIGLADQKATAEPRESAGHACIAMRADMSVSQRLDNDCVYSLDHLRKAIREGLGPSASWMTLEATDVLPASAQ